MLNVTKEAKGNVLVVRLVGTIDETANFEQLIGAVPAEVHVLCKEITRINSVGVKAWIRYFSTLRQKGVKLRFLECATVIVDQINLVSNFTGPGEVDSIFVPFRCTHCKTELVGLFKIEDLKRRKLKLPELKCSKCAGKVEFDDIPEEYFGFMMRS